MTRSLQGLADHLACLGVTRVVMEATSDYWRPVFYVLEAAGFQTWLVNAHEVKHLPGRPKTDRLDAVWLCKVAERQMIRPSFVPPAPIRRLRDMTRYRIDLVAARTAEKQRAEKLLEDAWPRTDRHHTPQGAPAPPDPARPSHDAEPQPSTPGRSPPPHPRRPQYVGYPRASGPRSAGPATARAPEAARQRSPAIQTAGVNTGDRLEPRPA
jgi:hypothetical protein